MRPDLFVYLSGPITPRDGYSAEDNVASGLRVHLHLLKHGVANFCPQVSGAFPSSWTDVQYEQWLAYDFVMIDRCTHVLMLPRWESSKGAQLERDYAIKSGKVITSLAGLANSIGIPDLEARS